MLAHLNNWMHNCVIHHFILFDCFDHLPLHRIFKQNSIILIVNRKNKCQIEKIIEIGASRLLDSR